MTRHKNGSAHHQRRLDVQYQRKHPEPLTEFQRLALQLLGEMDTPGIERRNGRDPTVGEIAAGISHKPNGLTDLPYAAILSQEPTRGAGGMSDRIFPGQEYESETQELLESLLNNGRRR